MEVGIATLYFCRVVLGLWPPIFGSLLIINDGFYLTTRKYGHPIIPTFPISKAARTFITFVYTLWNIFIALAAGYASASA